MLVLLETKMVEHKNITEALKYDNYIQTTADGLSWGIVIMWKKDLPTLDGLSITPQGLHVLVKVISDNIS